MFVVSVVRAHPSTMHQFLANASRDLTEELLREAVKDKPALEKVLRATGALDDEPARAKGKHRR